MERSVGALVARSACAYGEKIALVVGEQEWTFKQLDERSSAVAAALLTRGIGKEDVVSIYSPNCAEWVIAYYGILKTGAIVNPLNLMLTAAEAAYAIVDCGSRAVFGMREKLAALQTELAGRPVQLVGLDAGEGSIESFADFSNVDVRAPIPVADVRLDDVSTIGYTSGTTGHPKGAMLSHRSILFNSAMTATFHVRTASDVVVSALPCSHVYGNIVMNSAIQCGMKLVLHKVFDEKAILESIERHRATLFEGVPTMYMYLLNSPYLDEYDLSSITRCTVGGQTMSPRKMIEVEEKFGAPLIELWGMTELGGLGTTHPLYGPRKHGSIGIPLPFLDARIACVDRPADVVSAGQIGELQIRGPMTMLGYFNRPDATAETLDQNGWLHTGDLAYADEDGYLYVVDRLKDMIITGGFNIYPAELERVICEHPGVAMAAVVGVPDETKGELAKAFVVCKQPGGVNSDDLFAFCRERLAAYKVPRLLEFVDELPRTSSGKIMRRKLKEHQ